MNEKVTELAGPGEEKVVLMGEGGRRGRGVAPPLDIYNVFFLGHKPLKVDLVMG
mgnify:CR=1 FL=1